eukprot:Em0003g572a
MSDIQLWCMLLPQRCIVLTAAGYVPRDTGGSGKDIPHRPFGLDSAVTAFRAVTLGAAWDVGMACNVFKLLELLWPHSPDVQTCTTPVGHASPSSSVTIPFPCPSNGMLPSNPTISSLPTPCTIESPALSLSQRCGHLLRRHSPVPFLTYTPSGILFYQINSEMTDFLGVKLHGGLPWLIFDVGSGPAVVGSNSTRTFSDGQWHTQVRQDAKLLDTTNSVLKDQLYSSHLLRLWRTGAANFSYSADGDDFDPSSLHFNEGKATVHSKSDKLNTTSGHLLDREKRDVILSSTGWLDDVIINAAQDLLKEQFEISGFQNTTLGCNLSFDILRISCSCRMPPAGRMIQCSHCKEQFHKKCERVTRNELSSLWQCRLVEDIPSKGICLRALKTFIYCNPEQEVLDCLYLCDGVDAHLSKVIGDHACILIVTLETKKTQGTQEILTDAAKLIFVCEIHFLADFTAAVPNVYTFNSPRNKTDEHFVIGGTLPIHKTSNGSCGHIDGASVQHVEAISYVIQRINSQQASLNLSGVQLSFELYDSCATINIALQQTLRLLTPKKGNGVSAVNRRVGESIGRYSQPLNWGYVVTINSGDIYGQVGINSFQNKFENVTLNRCVAGDSIEIPYPREAASDYDAVVAALYVSNATVVVLFMASNCGHE